MATSAVGVQCNSRRERLFRSLCKCFVSRSSQWCRYLDLLCKRTRMKVWKVIRTQGAVSQNQVLRSSGKTPIVLHAFPPRAYSACFCCSAPKCCCEIPVQIGSDRVTAVQHLIVSYFSGHRRPISDGGFQGRTAAWARPGGDLSRSVMYTAVACLVNTI